VIQDQATMLRPTSRRATADKGTPMPWQKRYLDKYYSRSTGWVDGTTEFHNLLASAIPSGSKILEVGAGPSNQTSQFLKTLGTLHGLDIDPIVTTNDALTTADILTDSRYPFPDECFDACISNYVIEHISDVRGHLKEVHRVLKPGGLYIFRTPNRFHYVTLVASVTPHWFHKLVANRLRSIRSDSHDPYPTFYRLNSRSAIVRHAQQLGFEVTQFRIIEKEPSYGMASRVFFLAFMGYERFVNSRETFAGLRANILALLRKSQEYANRHW
jgi:ubiquinone/menaquinone biosynthesis C-methylase UbiE